MPKESARSEYLRKCLNVSFQADAFRPGKFFSRWFREAGSSHLFVFKKNLKVTNLQVAELHALMRVHTKRRSTGEHVRDFQALSLKEFNASVQSIVESFVKSKPKATDLDLIADLYSDLLEDVVVMDLFFGSCAVFLPHDLEVDLAAVCAQSGYIHSCGPSLLNRNITKAEKSELFSALRAYISKRAANNSPARFIVYAHEEFTDHDRYLAGELRDGLDDLKLYMDKYFIGNESLVAVLKEMRSHAPFIEHLEIPEPGHYPKALQNETALVTAANESPTLWLIVDHKPGRDIWHKGDEQYFLVYEQSYINQNPLYLFDENKPAWIDHTTIAHTLVSAMINITRPWWPSTKVCIGDPFVGSGTTWIEALKFEPDAICLDNEPIASQLVSDNLEFIFMSQDRLEDMCKMLEQVSEIDPTTKIYRVGTEPGRYASPRNRPPFEEDFFWALDRYEEACPDQHSREVEIDNELAGKLAIGGFERRVIFYVALRTHRRNLPAFERDAVLWGKAFKREASQLVSQMREFLRLRKRAQRGEVVDRYKTIVFPGKYSRACSVDLSGQAGVCKEVPKVVKCADARSLPPGSCDVILTDPPYGLNAEYDRRELAKLYQDVLPVMIDALRPEGQLVFAVPDWTHIGRQVPFFMTKQFITQQVLAAAEKLGKEVVQSAYTVPAPGAAFRPPYYWESDRALRRAIVHFRIRDLERAGGPADHTKGG